MIDQVPDDEVPIAIEEEDSKPPKEGTPTTKRGKKKKAKDEATTEAGDEQPKQKKPPVKPETPTTKRGKEKKAKDEAATQVGDEQPKQKKPRVKPEKVQEVKEKMIEELKKNYSFGQTEISRKTLALAVGYKHERSDAVNEALKLLAKEGTIAKKTADTVSFEQAGIDEYVPKEQTPVYSTNDEALQRRKELLLQRLSINKKTSSAKAAGSAEAMFDELSGGMMRTKEELLGVTHYGMERSTGFPETLNAFKALRYVDVVGGKEYKFTDSMFPFGRPE